MTVDLDKHLQYKLANHPWIEACLSGQTDQFPYYVDPKKEGSIGQVFPAKKGLPFKKTNNSKGPLFLINIPFGKLPSAKLDCAKYQAIFTKLVNESFGKKKSVSTALVKGRMGVVIGINQIFSMDPPLNRRFIREFKNLPAIKGIPHYAIGFFTKPNWQTVGTKIYPISKGFLLLKALNPKRAKEIRQIYESDKHLDSNLAKQIPFQRIRETIKNCTGTRLLLAQMGQALRIYYVVMDSDFLSIRGKRGQAGVFSQLQKLIRDRNFPSIISPGYRVHNKELKTIYYGVKIDMAVRAAMAKTLMPYFPEPCTAFKVQNPNQEPFLHRLSFLGDGKALETRRLIQDGEKHLTDGFVFEDTGALITTTPSRMVTKTNQKQERNFNIKTTGVLSSLRAVSQSHALPRTWAESCYAALNFSCSIWMSATKEMQLLFNVYDPISRMEACIGKFTERQFDLVMTHYNDPLTAAQISIILNARSRLASLGMKQEMIDQVQKAAKDSGQAIYSVLQEIS